MQTILVTGGTGTIGRTLIPFLQKNNYKVIILTRSLEDKPYENVEYALWNIKNKTINVEAMQRADYIIHLAGAGVVDHKWTKEYKRTIVESRTESSALLVDTLRNNKNEVKAIVSASAIGYYGPDTMPGKAYTEDDPAGNDFLATTCKLWEESIEKAKVLGIRVCTIRTGIVLSAKGGALPEFGKSLKFGIASILGSGKQMVSWIHVMDHCRILLQAIEHSNMEGAYNSVAPQPVTNKHLTTTLARIRKGSFYAPMHVPAFVLKLIMGERSQEILKSTTVSSTKIRDSGFTFIHPTLQSALQAEEKKD